MHNRMHPLTKLVVCGTLFLLGGLYLHPYYLIPLFVISLGLTFWAKIPPRWHIPIYVVAFLSRIGWGFHTLFLIGGENYQVLDPVFAETYIVRILPPGTPIVGEMALTYGNLILTICQNLRVIIMGYSSLLLVWTTPMNDIIDLFKFLPAKGIFVFTVAYRFVPVFLRKMLTVQNAQRLRGWEAKTLNPFRLLRQYWVIFSPALMSLMELADGIMRAAKARAVGASTTVLGVLHPKPLYLADKAVIALLAVLNAVLLYLLFFRNMGAL